MEAEGFEDWIQRGIRGANWLQLLSPREIRDAKQLGSFQSGTGGKESLESEGR